MAQLYQAFLGARGEVAVRDLVSRRQESVPRDGAVQAVCATVRTVEHRGP